MKRCPDCGSLVPDSINTCGVCGKDLVGEPVLETSIEQEEIEAQTEEREREQMQARAPARHAREKAWIGVAASIGTLVLGAGIAFLNWFGNSAWARLGILLLPFGAWVLANIVLGGLGRGVWGEFVSFSARHKAGYLVETAPKLEEEKHDALNPEGIREEEEVREEREKDDFD